MAGSKRRRELARAKYERQQERRARDAARRRRTQWIAGIVVVALVVVGAGVWVFLSNRSSGDAVASDSASPSASAKGAKLDCSDPGTVRANDKTYTAAPKTGAAKTLTLHTNCGDIVIAMDDSAPATTASETFLAKDGFYDDTTCHRLTTSGIFVLQCGDPTASGTGGPGYKVPDENLPKNDKSGVASYPAGTVAMANSGPGTSGSQFFIVYDDTKLPGNYSVWGKVTKGLPLVKAIASHGTVDGSDDGSPAQPVFITSATVAGT